MSKRLQVATCPLAVPSSSHNCEPPLQVSGLAFAFNSDKPTDTWLTRHVLHTCSCRRCPVSRLPLTRTSRPAAAWCVTACAWAANLWTSMRGTRRAGVACVESSGCAGGRRASGPRSTLQGELVGCAVGRGKGGGRQGVRACGAARPALSAWSLAAHSPWSPTCNVSLFLQVATKAYLRGGKDGFESLKAAKVLVDGETNPRLATLVQVSRAAAELHSFDCSQLRSGARSLSRWRLGHALPAASDAIE